MLEYKAQPADAGIRLDVVVASLYPDFSRSSLEMLFDKQMVNVNKKLYKAAYKVQVGDKIVVNEEYIMRQPDAIDLPIIYEDNDVIVVDKPAGVLTHSKGALNLEPTLASFVKPKLTDKHLVGNRAGIVHRLDRQTSGVIIAAKNNNALHWLQKQFSLRKTKKSYEAIVDGIPSPPQAIIDAPIARNPKKPQTFYVSSLGKASQTEYKLLQSFFKAGKDYSLLEIKPQTGRTHQIRVHMAYIGHPVVGDGLYGHEAPNLMLHAKSLELTLPSKERRVFEAGTPKIFREFINER